MNIRLYFNVLVFIGLVIRDFIPVEKVDMALKVLPVFNVVVFFFCLLFQSSISLGMILSSETIFKDLILYGV